VASRDAFVSLSGLARASRRIRLGVQAMSPFEMHPLKVASALLTLNELCGGRASILVGSGGAIFGPTGIKPVRPVRATRECIEILKGLSAARPLNYAGEIFTVRNYRPEWATQPAPRILAGANRPQMLRLAARAADGILMSDMPLPLVSGAVATVREAQAQAGRTGLYEFNNWWAWHVKEDRAAAMAEARSQIVLRGMLTRPYLEPFLSKQDCDLVAARMPAFYKAYRSRSPVIEGVPEPIVETLVENLTLTSDLAGLDARIEHLKAFEKAGLTHITLGLHGDLEAAIRIVGERVIPALA
jgi:5,10-methylenetetrahydromethanopterin reductase